MKLSDDAAEALHEGVDRIREQYAVPGEFPAAVLAEADEAAAQRFAAGGTRTDRTDVEFVTLDPLGSTDLDQAFALETAGDDVVLHYAIADVAAFVRPGGAVDAEAWRRGVTIYLPDRRAPLHPPVLSEAAASLLPDGPRPAVVFTVRIAPDGAVRLDGAERALVRNRAQLAYEHAGIAELPAAFAELARRIESAETARGADRIEFAEQELRRDGDGYRLSFRPRIDVERAGAALSLATNLAIADALFAAGTGIFRTMPPVDARGERALRHTARAIGLVWPADVGLVDFERSLPRDSRRAAAFQLAMRRAGGRATYEPYREGAVPWHAAVAATYVHATAPLRRLADRHVIEATLAVVAGEPLPEWVAEAFERLPAVMDAANGRAAQVENAAIDLAETLVLAGREGEVFDAVVTDEDARGVRIQLTDPAVTARTVARRVDPGDDIRVKLLRADPASRSLEFARVS